MLPADGIFLKEVNRLLRSNGYFVYSAPPAYRKDKDYPLIWNKLVNLTSAMCWKLIARKVQTAIWIKQENQSCILDNAEQKLLNVCDAVNDSKPSWNTPMRNCIQVPSAQTNFQNLRTRAERLSVYSESLSKIGLSIFFFRVWKELLLLFLFVIMHGLFISMLLSPSCLYGRPDLIHVKLN